MKDWAVAFFAAACVVALVIWAAQAVLLALR